MSDPGASASTEETATPAPASTRDQRQAAVLQELAREDAATVAFQGLKRRLGLHQQQLTRTLQRLEEDGLIEAADGGYRLSEHGFEQLAGQPRTGPRCSDRPLAQALLPPQLDPADVEAALAERWFDGLRWYGRSSGPGETTLIWLTEPDHHPVRLRVTGATVTVAVDCCWAPEEELYAALHPLLSAVTELYTPDGRGQAG